MGRAKKLPALAGGENGVLPVKQITVRSSPGRGQYQLSAVNRIDQQPVRLDVTFPKSGVQAAQRTVLISLVQGTLCQKRVDRDFQKAEVESPLLRQLIVPPKLRGRFQYPDRQTARGRRNRTWRRAGR